MALMVLLFLASLRATVAVFLSIPLSALAAVICLYFGGGSINSMVLAGLAIVFSRLIDNSVIVLENIFRHLEMGESPEVAAEKGGQESRKPERNMIMRRGWWSWRIRRERCGNPGGEKINGPHRDCGSSGAGRREINF